ncbi:MAG: hypothetical protein P8Y42_10450 [Exilibacterium sp.]
MTTFPGSPKVLRGGIVLIDNTTAAVQRIIALQYNPDTLTRSLQIKGVSGESGDQLEALRLKGPPIETIQLEAELDATDQLASANPTSTELGLHPQLAALEAIIYPTSNQLLQHRSDAAAGSIEIAPAQGPLCVFIFGSKRIMPVRITEFSITEEAFDIALNPIRAKINLSMRVLSVDDLGFDSKGGGLFMTYLQAKEQLVTKFSEAQFAELGIDGIS